MKNLTIREVAKRLNISEMSVHQSVRSGRIEATKVAYGKIEKWEISEEALEKYLASRGKRETKQYIVVLNEQQYQQLKDQGYEIKPRFAKSNEETAE